MAPKKKKLSKKEKQRLADEYDKLMKAQMEQERLRQVKEEKERAEKERKLAKERAKREVGEQELRCQQLAVTCKLFKKLKSKMKELERNNRALEEWNQYMKCDGLPDPNSFSQMNTYLFLWTGDESTNEIEKALQKTDEVLQLLGVLDELIFDPPYNVTPRHIEEWKKIRNDMRYQQQKHLDTATYKLLRNLEKNLKPIDLTTCKFISTSQHFTLYLWAEIVLPVPVSGANESKQSLTVDFPDVGVSLLLPPSLSNFHMAIRALWLKYDHCSDLCPSHDGPENRDVYSKDLNDFTLEEWETKCELQQQRENETKKQKTKGKDKNANIELPKPMEPQKSIADIIADKEEEQIKRWKKEMTTETATHEVNLRKCCVLGGVLHLDLLDRPPQPRDLRGKYVITVLDTPPGLNPVPYYEHYVPPPPPEPGARRTPEEIELEVKKQEEALDKLSAVTISLPETVLWFEPPMAANWDPDNNYWSTEEIHDLKFNEDKQTLTFRSGRMGLMSLVAYRYCNLPYQTWELKPDFKGPPGGVVYSITASVVIIEFIIREDKVCLSQLQNGATGALQEIVGTFYKPKKLMKLMQTGGVDVFPPPDAFCYVEGAVPKHRVAEDHLYHCMAMVSTSYNFAWSRWNLLAGRRNMVLQMREAIDRKRLPNYNILHVTPLKATIVDCTEVSTSFNEEGIEGMKFYADLYNLVLDQCSKPAKKKMEEIPFTLTETVHQLLCATRPFCFS